MSRDAETVVDIVRKLHKLFDKDDVESAADLLDALDQQPISVQILSDTRIGLILNELRKKTTNEVFNRKAKNLIKALPMTASFSGAFPPKELEHDEFRIKACGMLLQALKFSELPDGTLDPEELAIKVEENIYKLTNSSSDEKYRSSLRSRVFNLRKNSALRENILTGVVPPEKFAVMTSEEMASDEIRKLREKFAKEAILDAQVHVEEGTVSDMFICGKCKGKKCTYRQLQTRSADEPMTTFVSCSTCGNRWKF